MTEAAKEIEKMVVYFSRRQSMGASFERELELALRCRELVESGANRERFVEMRGEVEALLAAGGGSALLELEMILGRLVVEYASSSKDRPTTKPGSGVKINKAIQPEVRDVASGWRSRRQ